MTCLRLSCKSVEDSNPDYLSPEAIDFTSIPKIITHSEETSQTMQEEGIEDPKEEIAGLK